MFKAFTKSFSNFINTPSVEDVADKIANQIYQELSVSNVPDPLHATSFSLFFGGCKTINLFRLYIRSIYSSSYQYYSELKINEEDCKDKEAYQKLISSIQQMRDGLKQVFDNLSDKAGVKINIPSTVPDDQLGKISAEHMEYEEAKLIALLKKLIVKFLNKKTMINSEKSYLDCYQSASDNQKMLFVSAIKTQLKVLFLFAVNLNWENPFTENIVNDKGEIVQQGKTSRYVADIIKEEELLKDITIAGYGLELDPSQFNETFSKFKF